MILHSFRGLLRRPARSRKNAPARQHPPRPLRTRPCWEPLEDRVLLDAQPVNLGEHLQFRLTDKTADWTQSAGVYSTTKEVMIGLQTASFQPLLLVEKGLAIDTNATRQSFTIKATQNAHNTLAYFPNSLTLLSPLWQFQQDYVFRGPDLQNLVCPDPKATCTPVTVAGAAVLPVADDVGLKIANMTGPKTSGTLVPSTFYLTQSNDALKIPQLKLSGRMSLNVVGSKLAKLADHLHVSFGDAGTYAVTADAVGLVQLGSKTGSGVWLSVSPDEAAKLDGTIGSVKIHWVALQLMWEQSSKTLSFAGQWELSLKDDDSNTTTPFIVNLGDQTNPGFKINFTTGTVERLQAAFVAGMSGGQSRATFNVAGATISLGGLFFLYDGQQDEIGVGGTAQMIFGKDKDPSGKPANVVNIILGNPAQDQAGLLIQNGAVQSFNGRFLGSFLVGGFGLKGNVTVDYKAAQPGMGHAAVADAFLRSPEAYEKLVGRYYADLLSRPGDAAGVQGWRDAVHAGRLSADQVAEAFLASDEFLAKALATGGGTDSEKYVRALYGAVLGRAATPTELANWVRYLDAGGSRVQMAQAFWRSPEHRGVQVDRLYASYLRRTADAPGRAGWVSALVGGVTEAEAARVFLASPEYRAAFDRPTAYLRGLYRDVLGRVPDGNGLAAWIVKGDAGHDSYLSLSGSLTVNFANFSAGVILPGSGLVIQDGDWLVAGGFGINVNGSFGIQGFQFGFNNLSVVYTRPADTGNPAGFDNVWTISGGAKLASFFSVEVDLSGGGLVIKNGAWDFEGIRVHVNNLTAGGFGLQDFLLQYQKTNDGQDYEIKVEATLALGFIEISVEFDYKDGQLASIGADFKAQGEDPGLPVADTGLFVTEIGFEVDNLDNLSQWVFEGTVAVAFGEGIQFEGQEVRLFTAEGSFKADSSEFVIERADFNLMNGYLAKGSGTLNLNWVKHQYHVALDVTGFDGIFEVKAEFDLNQFGQVTVFADIGVNIPNGVPFIGGDRLADLEGLLYIDPVAPTNDLVAAWIDINTYIFGHFRLGAEFRFFPAPGQDRFQILWGSDVEKLEAQATSHEGGFQTTFKPTLAATGGIAPNQSLFALEWDNSNVIGDVAITIPGVMGPVTIPQSTWGSSSPPPVKFTYNGNPYVVQPVKEVVGAQRVAWIVGPDTTGKPANSLLPLPLGQYTVVFTTAETLNGKLTHAEAFAPPEVKAVTLTQPAHLNQVAVQASYVTADPGTTTIDFYITTDPKGTSGTLLQGKSISLKATDPNTGTVQTTVDLTDLTWKQPYYIFTRISDVAKDLSGKTTTRTSAPTVSATSVTPYADLFVQLKIAPDVPVDQQPATLSGWPILWQQLGGDGKTVVQTVRDVTDASGQAGITARAGTNWTVIVAPKDWDGFAPLPGPGQSGNANGQLITTKLSGGSYAAPRQVTVQYQNMISVHGQVSLDVSGSLKKQLGGAGLPGEIVYNDLNKNSQWDAGEPRTATDLNGFYDLRFPLPANKQVNTYTIRLTPDPSAVATLVRTNPDSTTDFSFQAGTAYTIAVDTSKANPRESFEDRDVLLQKQFLLSGTAYVSGPNGQPYAPGAVPVVNATINLSDATGKKLGSTTTGADGGYQFQVPGPGRYLVATDQQQPAQVNVPGRREFRTDSSQPVFPLSFTTPQGAAIYRMRDSGGGDADSGDFFGDGHTSFATLGISPQPQNINGYLTSNLYLTIVRGADARSQVSSRSVQLVANIDVLDLPSIPSVFWSEGLNAFTLPIPWARDQSRAAQAVDPRTGQVRNVPFPANAPGMNMIMGVSSSKEAKSDTWLVSDANSDAPNAGNNWMLLQYADYAAQPKAIASFNFRTSNGVRPNVRGFIGSVHDRWTAFVQGDLDGDGIDDFVFDAVDTTGKSVLAYLLSRERDASGMFTQVHTLSLGGSASSLQIVGVNNDPSDPDFPAWLAVHRVGDDRSDELVLLSVHPATQAQRAAGAAATSFAFESAFDLFALWIDEVGATYDYQADMNGDGFQDLIVIAQDSEDQGTGVQAAVLLNQGNGQFTLEPLVTAPIPNNEQFDGDGMLLSVGPGPRPGTGLPSVMGISENQDGSTTVLLATNTSFFANSYWAEVNSPGSYGGYHFGFVTGSPGAGQALSGTAYTDENGNGRQDPGEPNLVSQRVQVTLRDGSGKVSNQVVQTDAAGRYRVAGSAQVILSVKGLSPRNSDPAHSPPALRLPWTVAPFPPSRTVGGQGAAVGGANLVRTLDYGDGFTLGVGTRAGLQPNGQPAGAQLNLEYQAPLAPARAWTPSWQISADVAAAGVPGLPYPGRSNAGSDGGIIQAACCVTGIEYGLRDQYVLQVDVVQTGGQVVLTSGTARGVVYGADTLSLLFFADDGSPATPGIQLTNKQGVADTVWDSLDGNPAGPLDPTAQRVKTGTKLGQWNNYAAAFDRVANRLALYANGQLLKTLDLTVFAGGAYRAFSNAAVNVGALGGPRVWMDNFQVGAPYVGYQTAGPSANRTGYDFGVKEATVVTGAIQGAVVLYNRNLTDPFAPTNLPFAGATVFLDLNGDSTPSGGEPQTTTDVHGGYQFTGLKPGSYVVRQALPSNYIVVAVQTLGGAPDMDSETISLDVLGGQTAYANNFSDLNRDQGAAGYVRALYRSVLGREADAGGQSAWVRFLEGGGSRAQVARAFWESAEHRGLQVDQLYATYLHRAADAAGLTHWVGALLAGRSENEVARALLASEEYRRAHGDDTAFVTGLHGDVLGRMPNAAELAEWRTAARFGIDRGTLADAFLSSQEANRRWVERSYAAYLGRAAEPAGVQGWLEALQGRRTTPAQVAQALLASDEFFARAAASPPG